MVRWACRCGGTVHRSALPGDSKPTRATFSRSAIRYDRVLAPTGPAGNDHDESAFSDSDQPRVNVLNRAVAVALVRGPAAGLELFDRLASDDRVAHWHRLYAIRDHLLQPAVTRRAYSPPSKQPPASPTTCPRSATSNPAPQSCTRLVSASARTVGHQRTEQAAPRRLWRSKEALAWVRPGRIFMVSSREPLTVADRARRGVP
jgi:hypothetical protein